jgi:subtilisin family serine protease
MMPKALGLLLFLASTQPTITFASQDVLVKLKPGALQNFSTLEIFSSSKDKKVEILTDEWVHIQTQSNKVLTFDTQGSSLVEYVQPNYKISIPEKYRIKDPAQRAQMIRMLQDTSSDANKAKDNPAIPATTNETVGEDPLFSNQWGMIDTGVRDAWKIHRGSASMIVAVLDTGVDYTHEDLINNLWRNPGETGKDSQGRDKSSNGVDDDNNGYTDDSIGWDFAKNDNKPYDLAVEPIQLLIGGGNPGHGTHCAGNVAARGNNSKGIAGVAPNVKIMSIRFMDEKGQGTTAEAIKAIKYAVDNGARILSNSWGSEGDDPNEADQNQALKDIIQYAQDHNSLFIAAAGNGHKGVGYDNDTDPKPAYPASYENENIISVAALDNTDNLGSFSNWGARTVDMGAPGVKVYSTTVGGKYSDKVIDILGFTVFWDGTSMATPHVAGAAALYWSAHPEKNWREVKEALMKTTTAIPALKGKAVSQGKLNVKALMTY